MDLDQAVSSLNPKVKAIFDRIFHMAVVSGDIDPPAAMYPWIKQHFGSIEAVLRQKIIRITNLVTWEGAILNPARTERPMERTQNLELESLLQDSSREDTFSDPLNATPADPFGRIEGEESITGANVAKYDGLHGLVIFRESNPLEFNLESLLDHIETAQRWLKAAHKYENEAKYPIIIWNCLWRAGASIIHGHFQMALGRDMHYAKVEQLRRAALDYKDRYGTSYFDDLFLVHQALGCGFETDGTQVLANIAPVKEKDVMLVSKALDAPLVELIYNVLRSYRDAMGVTSFNMAIILPPMTPGEQGWEEFPVLVRAVDRGDLDNQTSDIGSMELFAHNIVSSNPLNVAAILKEQLR